MLPPEASELDSNTNMEGCKVSLRPLVNGATMHKFVGRTVTLLGTVISVNPNSTSFDLKTSDMQIVIVSMRKPLPEPVSGLVEVQGTVQGRNSMVCDYYMTYPAALAESYDQELADKIVNLLHSVPSPWMDDY